MWVAGWVSRSVVWAPSPVPAGGGAVFSVSLTMVYLYPRCIHLSSPFCPLPLGPCGATVYPHDAPQDEAGQGRVPPHPHVYGAQDRTDGGGGSGGPHIVGVAPARRATGRRLSPGCRRAGAPV